MITVMIIMKDHCKAIIIVELINIRAKETQRALRSPLVAK